MGPSNVVLFAALLAIGAADLADFDRCDESNDDMCKISEVRVDPCPAGDVCVFRHGTNVSLAFDFTPNFSVSNLKTMVYNTQSSMDIKFDNFGSENGCDYTSCPTAAGQSQTLNYNLYVGRRLPKATYQLKWKLWNTDNETEKCCFKIKIKLMKAKKAKAK